MPQAFTVIERYRETEGSASATGEFSDAEWELLVRFADYADELRSTRVVSQGARVSYSVKWSQEDGESQTATLPPPDDLSAFLHRLRPFILDGEPTFAPKICKVLKRRITLPGFRERFDILNQLFFGKGEKLSISLGEVNVNTEQTLKKWLNAFEYHRDLDKQEDLVPLTKAFPDDSLKAILAIELMGKATVIIRLAQLVRGIQQRGQFELIVPGGAS